LETLKKILTSMVILLVVLVVAGGIYMVRMGNMNHGNVAQYPTNVYNQSQKQEASDPAQGLGEQVNDGGQNQRTQGNSVQNPPDSQQNGSKQSPDTQKGGSTPVAPVIIQVPPQPIQKDTSLQVQMLKERLKTIDEINSIIASNSGPSIALQQNGAPVQGGSGMNELHRNFYRLGQNVSSMEQALDSLAKDVKESSQGSQYYGQQQVPQYYPYGYFQGPQTNYNQQGLNQLNQPNQQLNQQPNTGPSGQVDPHASAGQAFSIGNILNEDTLKLVFTFILLGSIVLGVIALVGFVGSLFKDGLGSPDTGGR